MNQHYQEQVSQLKEPTFKGSYPKEDCIFMLKDIGDAVAEEQNEIREQKMAGGTHYSEMLPVEKYPTEEYLNLFEVSLQQTASLMAQYVADVTELILKERGNDVIFVSLARAGTPIGVLMKRYAKERYGLDIPHYSISIIRGKGIDENAVLYITNKHQSTNLQFIDGWTGKGAIGKVLEASVHSLYQKYDLRLSPELAVLADPSHSASIYGTREDYFLPSSCLNSIVSGLASRTVHRDDLIGEFDYHGSKYYEEWELIDFSRYFVDKVACHFANTVVREVKKGEVTFKGWKQVEEIQRRYQVNDINKIKPGIGETTRVLLRRVPYKLLIKENSPKLDYILALANEKNVPVEIYPHMSYSCVGLIRESE